MKRIKFVIPALAVVMVAALLSYQGPTTASATAMFPPPAAINDPDLIFPAVRIVRFENLAARFDTATGEVARFHGTIAGGSANGTWVKIIRPLTVSNSGFLDLQQAAGGTFLVDLESGNTWVLRRSGNSLGSWVRVQ